MFTVRIDCFILGYRSITVPEDNIRNAANLLLREGVSTRIRGEGIFILRERDYKKLASSLAALGATASGQQGLPGIVRKYQRCYGVMFAAVLLAVIAFFSADLVWEVRIEGNESVGREKIIAELADCGFGVGTQWSKTDRSKVESDLLAASDGISWVNINRRGSVAYVSVVEKMNAATEENEGGYSNIIATVDCVIEEITVYKGHAAVKAGEAVKAGDLLISGIMPQEAGGGFCHAEGTVLGRVEERVSVSVAEVEEKYESKEEALTEMSLHFFGFSINIFKKYGNVAEGCDIIEDVEDCVLFGKFRLPISVTKLYARERVLESVTYSTDEIVKIASSRLNSMIKSQLHTADLVALRTVGAFVDGGYTMTSDLTVIRDVGVSADFEVSELYQ